MAGTITGSSKLVSIFHKPEALTSTLDQHRTVVSAVAKPEKDKEKKVHREILINNKEQKKWVEVTVDSCDMMVFFLLLVALN